MIKNELKLYLKSKLNLLMLIFMSIPVILSYVSTNNERIEWQQQLQSAASDLNIEKTQAIVNGYSGASYLFNFLFSADYFIIFFLVSLMGMSCIFGAKLFNQKKNGFGNMAVIRMGYSNYLKKMLIAQVLYTSIFLLVYFLVLVMITEIVFPFRFNQNITCNFPLKNSGVLYCLGTFALQILLTIFIETTMMLITSLGNVIFNNKYLIHCIPLILYFIPYILASTIGNLSVSVGNILSKFVIDNNFLAFYFYKISDASKQEFLKDLLLLPIILALLAGLMYFYNKKHFERDYQ